MNKQSFEGEIKKYNAIEIPNSLDLKVKQSLKLAKKKRKSKRAFNFVIGVAALFTIFITTVNIFPEVAKALSSVPGLEKLIHFITFDKGLENAVKKGEYQEINYTEEQNGVKLTITSIAGDSRHLWVGYKLEGEEMLSLKPEIMDVQSNNSIPYFSSISLPNGKEESFFEIGFGENKEFSNEIKLICEVYKNKGKDENNKPISTFEVPITLDSSIFKDNTRVVEIENKDLHIDIGMLNFYKITTSTTRISLEFSLSSDQYEFMSFKNPRLEDKSGKVYSPAGFYSTSTIDGKNKIDFQGELQTDNMGITFKCDGIYYLKAKEDYIIVDLKNRLVEPNSFGFKFINLENNKLAIGSDKVASASFNEVKDQDGKTFVKPAGISVSTGKDKTGKDKNSMEAYFDVDGTIKDKLRLEVTWILDEDKMTKPYSIILN